MRAILYLALVTAVGAAIPNERTAIFSAANTPHLIELCIRRPAEITGYWQADQKDLVVAQIGIDEFLANTWSAQGVTEKRRLSWKHYYLQVGGIIKDGRRMLMLSYAWAPDIADEEAQAKATKESETRGRAFDKEWWKTRPISVRDGGWQFFRVIYDMHLKRFTWYDQNLPLE